MNIDDVKKFAGHSDIRTTQQYVHMNQEEAIKKHTAYAESIRPDNLQKTGLSD